MIREHTQLRSQRGIKYNVDGFRSRARAIVDRYRPAVEAIVAALKKGSIEDISEDYGMAVPHTVISQAMNVKPLHCQDETA